MNLKSRSDTVMPEGDKLAVQVVKGGIGFTKGPFKYCKSSKRWVGGPKKVKNMMT